MTCQFDLERIALFVNDDLAADEREGVAAHLAACPDCRSQMLAFGADSEAIAAVGSSRAVPQGLGLGLGLGRRRARRPWLPAAVAAALLLVVAGATRVEAIEKRLIVLFPFLQVQEMSPAELHELVGKPPSGKAIAPVDFESVASAEKAVGYRMAQLGRIPEGYVLKRVYVSHLEAPLYSTVGQVYVSVDAHANLTLHQTRSGQITALTEEGTTRELTVKGEKAALVERQWSGADGVKINRTLFFQWKGQAMQLTSAATEYGGKVLSADELVRLAEALQ